MKSASFIFDRRLYELLQEEGRTKFTIRELRDAYAKNLVGMNFRVADVRRYVYEQIRRLLRMGWVVLDKDRRVRGQNGRNSGALLEIVRRIILPQLLPFRVYGAVPHDPQRPRRHEHPPAARVPGRDSNERNRNPRRR